MNCSICSHEISEISTFCPFCGSPLNVDSNNEEAYISCNHPSSSDDATPPKRKKSRWGLIILAVVAGILVIGLIAGLCTNWFGFYGPAAQIASAASNTLKAGSFTMEINSEITIIGKTLNIDGTAEVMLDPENRDLKLYSTMHVDKQNVLIVICDNYLITSATSGHHYQKQNISGELEAFFDSLEKDRELDWEELLNGIQDGLYDEVSEVIAFDALEACLIQYYRNLNNDKWLEENAGYSFTKENGVKKYQFKPNSYEFLNTSLACFEDAFIEEEKYDQLVTGLNDSEEKLNEYDVMFAMGISQRELSSIEVELKTESISVALEIEFKNIGKTVINEKALQKIMLEAFS